MDRSNLDFGAALRAISNPGEIKTSQYFTMHEIGQAGEELNLQTEPKAADIPQPLVPGFLPINSQKIEGSGELVQNVKKIAILRSNGIGDFVFALPAIQALRLAYPEAEIVYLGLQWHARFMNGRPGPIDRVEVVPRIRGVGSAPDVEEDPRELEEFYKQMHKERFDIAIQMHGGGRYSNPMIQRLRARLTVGACAEDAIPLDRWVPYEHYQMEVLRFLEIAGLVGAVPGSLEPRITLLDSDLAEAANQVPYSEKPLVVLHPGASDARRRWPVSKFAAVGNAMAWSGAQVIVTGNQAEQALAEGVIKAMSAPATNLCGRLSLGGLAGLLSRSSVVISNDSGPLHLARAVGAATVGIYWCGNMINAGPVTRARHRTAVSWRLECPVCGLNCTRTNCGHSDSFVADVPDVEVKTAALELLESDGPHLQRPPLEFA